MVRASALTFLYEIVMAGALLTNGYNLNFPLVNIYLQ